ncbi:serine--tRNA ligase [Pseudomonas hunanensis]|uniref:serine--tRNA ligase n=1 Tax=Pseudomonas hunanensis TaxID=1247546 RepID=UPI0030D9CD51
MFDMELLRGHLREVAERLARRSFKLDASRIESLEERRVAMQALADQVQVARNTRSELIRQARARGQDVTLAMAEIDSLGEQLNAARIELVGIQAELDRILLTIPNLPDASVPQGSGEDGNIEMRRWGAPRQFDFEIKDYAELGERCGGMDFEAAARLSGANFSVLRGHIAHLHRSLVQFMLDLHTAGHGYKEVYVPYLLQASAMQAVGHFTDEEDHFLIKRESERNLYLVPSLEASLSNLVAGQILDGTALPQKFVAHGPCFVSKVSTSGRDRRGIMRQRQFDEVAIVQIVEPSTSMQALEEMTVCAERVLQLLQLPYRVMNLCCGELGFSAVKTYRLEVWMPSKCQHLEVGTCSISGDLNARRMQTRWRDPETGKAELVHTLSGSGLAVGVTLAAILENYQEADGSIKVPVVLESYMREYGTR